ncbi:MAG: type IV pilus assembly protein PilY1, partial [Gammaproteobacteria bacterium]
MAKHHAPTDSNEVRTMTNHFPQSTRCSLWLARVQRFLFGLSLAIFSSTPVLAQDVEVYQNKVPSGSTKLTKPNVLFIIDTSGSMLNAASGQKPFDPGKAQTFYDGGTGTCLHDRVYWSKDGKAPDCSTAQFFEFSKLRCNAAVNALAQGGLGTYQDRLARYATSTRDWRGLGITPSDQSPPHVECRADRGVHGPNATDSRVFIFTNEASPWQSTPTGESNWQTTGEFYTLFSSKYMNYLANGAIANPGVPKRIDVVRAATNQIVAANNQNILAGLMRFDTKTHCDGFQSRFCSESKSGNKGGPVVFPISDIAKVAERTAFQNAVNALNARGETPLAETLYEALLYFQGKQPFFGGNPPIDNAIQSVTASLSAGVYKSPIVDQCQKNHIIYLTDGAPFKDFDADGLIKTALEDSTIPLTDRSCAHDDAVVGGGDNCLDELAEVLAKADQSALDGNQHVNVHTIGFLTNQTLLSTAATKGNGK